MPKLIQLEGLAVTNKLHSSVNKLMSDLDKAPQLLVRSGDWKPDMALKFNEAREDLRRVLFAVDDIERMV